jgi:hypothetical protein
MRDHRISTSTKVGRTLTLVRFLIEERNPESAMTLAVERDGRRPTIVIAMVAESGTEGEHIIIMTTAETAKEHVVNGYTNASPPATQRHN